MEKGENLRLLPNRENYNCFGCSPSNPSGLQMKFYTDENAIFSWLTVPTHLSGWNNLVHGGVLSTILDETMGWTVIHFLKKFALTHSMTVKFKKPVYIGEELLVEGRMLEVKGEREATVEALLYKGEKKVLCARSTGSFRLFTADGLVKLGIMEEEAVRRFSSLTEP